MDDYRKSNQKVRYSYNGKKSFTSFLLSVLFLFVIPIIGIAQQKNTIVTVSGVVLDSSGEPIIGANVVEKGTTNGTITDIDGNFSLTLPYRAILKISYIGYNTQEITIGS